MHRWGNKKDMAVNIGDDPPYLSVGTEVSAKYKGAFCEAKIRKVVKAVKCKVQYKNESGSAFVNDEQIKGVLMPGASVEVKQPDKKEYIEGTIVKIQDLSQYTVVFDDGDIATLRRTALCLKSGRHFAESETLDQLPLTHPEHFSTPVVSGIRGSRRRDDMEDNSDNESKRERKIEREEDMGKVVCVEVGDKKKSKDNWFPGLIVAPNAQDSVKIDVEDEYLVRSFKDGRYYTVPKRETVEFTREVGSKVDHPTLKMAVEKAISFLDKDDLPPHWDREVLFGMADYTSESDGSDTDSTDDEPREEKDHFVAQLYKFMDDRSTPINKGPVISSKDVDLYKLFKIVNKLGGYNRVTNRNQWKSVAIKLGYTASQTNNVKTSYKKFLHNFEDFYRKLGCTMMSPNVNNKLRSRSSRPLIRDRDKALPASPQLYKLKNKDDILNNSNAKTRKLSIGHDNRNLLGIGAGNGDRKSTSSSTSGGNTSDGGNSTGTTGKSRKTDEEGVEGPKKKTYTRKKKDEDKFLTSSADNLINQSIDIVSPYKTICVGDKLKVYYGPTHESKVTYEAKVMNKRYGPVTEYFVHYTGWNTRYDEWIRRSRIAEDLSWTPARDKLKYSQNDTPSSSQSSSQSDQTSLQSQTTTKTGTEKVKRSSISPVGKYPSKSINKVGTRQGRGAKSKSPSKFDVKGKKLKDSETSDESETESLKKRELQKTRSRTEKQKQQDEDTGSKDIPYQKTKKTPPLKRTRSGSLKSESKEEEPVKKRKVTPAKSAAKTSRTNAIRNSIMKNLVGRKRIADKGKKLFKKKDPSFDKESDDFDSKDTDKINESMEADDAKDLAELRIDIEKSRICEDLKLKTEEEIERMNCEETELVLKIKPFVTTGVVLEELPVSVDKAVGDSDREKSVEDESDDNGPPVLKKEVILDDEANASPISANLFLADSYLAENLEKQKLVKGKTKKDSEEKSPPSASKIFNRGSAEKSTVKANCDAKEKTFFPSRIDKVETKKVENTDKDKKDKLKNVNTFTSYLSMDKIDSIRKVNSLEKSPADKGSAEKSTSLQKSMDGGNELDIYEFKEPEPFEFRGIDDCPILHRRTATRLFDESPYKRPNKTSSSPGDSTKDEDFFKITDEMDLKSDKDESIEIDEKLVPKTAEPEKCEKLDSVDSTKIKETQNIDLEELDIAETSIEKSESLVEESNEIKISTILVSADSSSKDILKIDELNESTLYGDLPNEDDEDDDLEEEKLVISECDQPDDDISCESIASKSEVTVVFKDFDNLDRTLDSKLPDSSDKPTDLAEIDPKIEDVIKLKPSSSESIILSKSSASLPAKKDDNTGENVVSSSNKSIEDEISEKLHADENLDSEDDDDSVSSLKSGSSFGDTKTSKETGGSDSVSDDKDSEYPSSTESSGAAAIEPTKKPEHSRTLSSETITYSYKKKTTHETKCESDDTKMDTTSGDEAGESSEASKADLSHHSVIDEVEIEIFTAAKKEVSDQADSKSVTETPANKESDWQSEKASDKEENHHKNKEEDDDDGLLLCEETIPKSPEGKDPSGSHDHDLSYPGSSGMSGSLKKAPEKKMKRVQRPSVFPAPGTIFENTPPTTPEGSTPGNSPSDERNGFSSNSFSLNEKSSLNKDSSENDTYSDNSERSLRTKKYRDENGTCSKKNSYDYDSYLKRKSDKDSFYKNDEPSKKKGKQSMPTSANESERDDYSDEGQSPKSTSLSQKFTKSSYYLELDPDLDANQRIEVLEQKLQELRKAYLALKQELSSIDKRRKKLRRREREGRMMTRNEANSLL
ncbi:AT-rich interactive domain-containing protein 4B isoform X3 [Planococcus citri]|uniref:AT-rich interactive domain-containing protein 4B isoform X3 n=1 Tax=Planococcus citri TaxID=170843 RepID=UPI0031F7C577